jgi:hypothetical protein
MLQHLYGAATASALWAADDAFTAMGPSPSERDARAFLIAKHGDSVEAYKVWERAMTGHGDELRELFAAVAVWKSGR